ncbi:hypothetical protein BJ138DRAFT_1147151 [Hygrophoropsis aurantiaca]|uniref:Uncharacterized protein n=1 Tax=Hygrophoropsis aurantiaca TaxID=72124 RepID=A0ACB8AHK4_9AGAM|nr:hypothetical protein BJ138DRAFT_1147151 [Hygrophoropsis aurantiaca]
MLKAHQACIDLEKNVLRIQGREVRFLSEHELPDKARIMDAGVEEPTSLPSSTQPTSAPSASPASSFPGGGNTLGSGSAPVGRGRGAPVPQSQTRHPESAIETLMGLGATREIAISSLDAAGGNLDVAASLLF